MLRHLLLSLSALLLPTVASSHTQGENYVFFSFKKDAIEGRFEFRLNDLKEKIGVDLIDSGESLSAKQQATAEQVYDYIREGFSVGPGPEIAYNLEFTRVDLQVSEGGFAQYYFEIDSGPLPDLLYITHNMCYENDRLHRGLIVVEENEVTGFVPDSYEGQIAMVFSRSNTEQTLDLHHVPSLLGPRQMVWQGVLHIWIGIDHVLFLLALLLPVVLERADGRWRPVPSFRRALWGVLSIVTVFTIAHSITLALASLEIIQLPSRVVESIIALSIILVAVNSILGRSSKGSLWIILLLGLFHGLGFASVMAALPIRVSDIYQFIKIILGFNIGVELGQIAILVAIFPLLFILRKRSFYVPVVLQGCSAILVVIAGYWFIERAFGL